MYWEANWRATKNESPNRELRKYKDLLLTNSPPLLVSITAVSGLSKGRCKKGKERDSDRERVRIRERERVSPHDGVVFHLERGRAEKKKRKREEERKEKEKVHKIRKWG